MYTPVVVQLTAKLCPTLTTPWTAACQAPLSIGFSRQEQWSGLPFPSPEDLPYPGIKPGSPALQAESLLTELPGNPMYILRFVYTVCTYQTEAQLSDQKQILKPQCSLWSHTFIQNLAPPLQHVLQSLCASLCLSVKWTQELYPSHRFL